VGRFSLGIERILLGYVKIVVLANQLVNVNMQAYIASIDPSREWLIAYLEMLAYGFNGYLQFAGYSDIAIGFALLLGYRVMENFNWPFLARNISEFWKRWHISLSNWCRNYIYMVVTSISRKPTLAILLSMLVLGLWHEISLRYVLWGVYHGVGIALWQLWKRSSIGHARGSVTSDGPGVSGGDGSYSAVSRMLLHGLAVLTTFHFVMLSFVILRHETIAEMLENYRLLLAGWW
jgi:D-alanyl-lipoteichoic acid acyltransferase DltB (MBOAT superfamily)